VKAGRVLLVPVGDPAARQVVRRHLDGDAIADQDANAIFAHLAGNRGEHDVFAVIEAHFEKGVGLLVDNGALRRNQIFCCQSGSPWVVKVTLPEMLRVRGHNNIVDWRLPIADWLRKSVDVKPPAFNRQSTIANQQYFELVQKSLDTPPEQA